MSRLDNSIAGTHLGKKSEYAEVYDPSLLVAVPRKPNRDNINVDCNNTPWKYAYDVWNCYEISSLLNNGQPFSGVGKIVYDGNTECIVESKSLKLYLNSFNQTRTKASSILEAYEELKVIIERDLSKLLNTVVRINISDSRFGQDYMNQADYLTYGNGSLISFTNIDQIINTETYTQYHENPDLLQVTKWLGKDNSRIHTSNLFSRCQITNQPDHGDLFITYDVKDKYIGLGTISKYIASIRGHSCFHEPTVETIFKHLYDKLNPNHLMVCAFYTRRGGISIAPIRSTHEELIPYNVINHRIAHVKLPRE